MEFSVQLKHMKNITTLVVIALLGFSQTAIAASDYLLELGGVKGESTRAPALTPTVTGVATPPPPPVETTAGLDAFIKIDGVDGETKNPPPPPPPPQPLETGDPTLNLLKPSSTSSEPKKANVEVNWKVEEGEKARSGGKVNIAVGDVDGDGMGEHMLPEPTPAQAVYIKLGDVKGEGMGVTEQTGFSLRAKELRESDEKTRAEVLALAPTSTDTIRDGNDLALFILREATLDPTIDSVDIASGTIAIEHQAEGKFLGLFTMSYRERIEVDAEGQVRVARPWFSFLVNEDVDEEDIAAVVREKKEKPIQIESWSFGASNAGMYKAISDVLKTKHVTAKNSVGNIR